MMDRLVHVSLLIGIALFFVIALLGMTAEAKIMTVDHLGNGDFFTIQEAVNNATDGDTILIHNGTYNENVVINKSITLTGNGTGTTIIDGRDAGTVIQITKNGVNITNFTILGNGKYHAILIKSSDNRISNVCSENTTGIRLYDGNNNVIQYNTVNGSKGDVGSGILLEYSYSNTIKNNTCTWYPCGIHLEGSDLNMVLNNTCTGNYVGISLEDSDKCYLSNNNCTDNSNLGMELVLSSRSNSLLRNNIASNGNGIALGTEDIESTSSDFNFIYKNIIEGNKGYGIRIRNANHTTLQENTISYNAVGMWFDSSYMDNEVHECNIFNNAQFGVNASKYVDMPLEADRNYWGAHTGPLHPDFNPEGEGDNITGNVHFSPWMKGMIDPDAPHILLPPTNLSITPILFKEPSLNVTYLKRGTNVTISFDCQSYQDYPNINHIVFQRCTRAHIYSPTTIFSCLAWEEIGVDTNVTDETYSIHWTPDNTSLSRIYLRAISYDDFGNHAESKIYSSIQVVDYLPDLTVSKVSFSTSSPIAGQEMDIHISVRNGGNLSGTANNVRAEIFAVDEDGNQSYIGEHDFDSIDPQEEYFPDDPDMGPGEKKATISWIVIPWIGIGEVKNYTINVLVDSDNYIWEMNETNNEMNKTMEIIGTFTPPPVLYVNRTLDNTMVSGIISLNGSVSSEIALLEVGYLIDEENHWYDAQGIENWSFTIDTTNLVDGEHQIKIIAVDAKAKTAEQTIIIFTNNHEQDDEDDAPSSFLLVFLLILLVILFIALILVTRLTDE